MGKGEGSSSGVNFAINGKLYKVNPSKDKISGEGRLVDYIRDNAGLKGTKFMCREGGCGACVVTVRTKDPATGEEICKAVNSCLTPVYSCDGWDISTVENVGSKKEGYHTIQKRLAKFHATQCGYCSPGMVMSMYSLLESKKGEVTMQDVEDNFDGNICRCTGYRPILDAFKSMAVDAPEELRKQCTGDIEDCAKCPRKNACGGGNGCGRATNLLDVEKTSNNSTLQLSSGQQWIQVNSVKSAMDNLEKLTKAGQKYRLVAGNTGSGVFKHDGPYDAFLDINDIPELKKSTLQASGVILGGGVSLTNAIALFKKAASLSGYEYAANLGKHIERVANVPVRNAGTLAGNLMLKHAHKSFQSDIFVILETVEAKLSIALPNGTLQMVTLMEFLGLNMTGKLIVSIHLPQKNGDYIFRSFKITRRYQNSHAYVNAGFLFKVDPKQNYKVLEKPRIVYGGISAEFNHASATETFLLDKCLGDEATLKGAFQMLDNEVKPDLRIEEATVEYRKQLTKSLLYKAVLGIVSEKTKATISSGRSDLEKLMSHGQQTFEKDEGSSSTLYKEVPKLEGVRQASGEAEYIGDIPPRPDELVGVFVLSTVANAELDNINASEALKIPGVVKFVGAADIPGTNTYTMDHGFFPLIMDEPIFADDKIFHYGQPVGMIVAETREIAAAAVKKVVVNYKNIQKPIVDIEIGIKQKVQEGTIDKCRIGVFQSKDQAQEAPKHILKGEFRIGSQYHFHMETQSAICIPKEDGMDIYSATQWIDHVQTVVANALKMPHNHLNISVRRIGGGFGGKVQKPSLVAGACAIAANAVNKPVRVILDMEENMAMMGKRPNYLMKYEVGFDDSGKICKLDTDIYGDVGFSPNEPIPMFAAVHLQGPYAAVGWEIKPYSIQTNTPSNTAVRAPGSPQAAFLIETIMEHVATQLGKDSLEVREANYLKQGDALIPAGEPLEFENLIPNMIEEIKKSGDYEQRKAFIEKFNNENRWKKRGMSLIPVRYPVGFFASKFPVQIVIYHTDGTVAVSHGGVEMGQGVNTKVAQIVSHYLNVPLDKIQIKPSNNFVAANGAPSGGSIASELCGDVARRAALILVERMKPVKEKLDASNLTWENLVDECYKRNVNLNASYVHSSEDELKPYNVWLVNLTEVEVDILTEEYKVVRTDLLEDAGKSLSPGVDIGQVEGGHIFGQGLYTTEKLMVDPITGKLLTNNTWEYKPPETKDISEDYRVTLLSNAPNPNAVLSSKATGEPVLCGSCAVVFALKNAIASARKDVGHDEWFSIDGPVTPEDVVRLSLTSDNHYGY